MIDTLKRGHKVFQLDVKAWVFSKFHLENTKNTRYFLFDKQTNTQPSISSIPSLSLSSLRFHIT
jgi:hypothetical protein